MSSRIAVLASGGGSNLEAMLEHFDRLGVWRGGTVTLVLSDRRDAGALERARRRSIATSIIAPDDGGAALEATLREHGIDLVVLAGYLRLVPAAVTAKYRGRILNIHPALLPAFGGPGMYGLRVHRAVIDAGTRVTGATVHFVDESYDRGAIIAQWPVPVFTADTPETLAERVLRVEHLLLPRVVDAVAAGRIVLDGNRARALPGSSALRPFLFSLEDIGPAVLSGEIERVLLT